MSLTDKNNQNSDTSVQTEAAENHAGQEVGSLPGNAPSFPAGTRVIFDNEEPKGRIIIAETADRCAAYILITRVSDTEVYEVEEICAIILGIDIKTDINTSSLTGALEGLSAAGDSAGPILITEGVRPVADTDGRVEVLFSKEKPYVEKDTLLLRRIKPIAGKAGRTIYGDTIEPAPGETPEIDPGLNIRQAGNEFYSKVYGKALFEKQFLAVHKAITATISSDTMEVCISYAEKHALTARHILAELADLKITHGIDNKAIDYIVATYEKKRTPIKDFVVARGTPPEHGRDGEILFYFPTKTRPRFLEKEDGSIDLRETHMVQSVEKDSELALLVPHVDPAPGKDVLGKIIPVQPIKKVALRPGKNVYVSEDGMRFFAAESGRPVLDRETICVSEIFSVYGNLDMSVGNVDFDGEVEVHGSVEDGYTVKASKSITIHGFVGASNIEAGLDITIAGGCNGNGKSRLLSGRDITAKYIDEAYIKATGDVTVKNEIINSIIMSLGRVTVQNGKICGGVITAKKGIETYDAGSQAGIKTVLIPGEDYNLNDQCSAIDSSISDKSREHEKIAKMLTPLLDNDEVLSSMKPEKQSKLADTISYLDTLVDDIKTLSDCKTELIAASKKESVPEAIVQHTLFPGTIVKIEPDRREITATRKGPIRLFKAADERVTVEPFVDTDKKEPETQKFKA